MKAQKKGFGPSNPWSRSRYGKPARFERAMSDALVTLLQRWPSLKRIPVLKWVADRLDREHARVVKKPKDVSLRLAAIQAYWFIPVENLDQVERGIYRLIKDCGVNTLGFGRSISEFQQAFERAKRLDMRTRSQLGFFTYDGLKFELSLATNLSHYATLSAQIKVPASEAERFAGIIEADHVGSTSILFPWFQVGTRAWGINSTSGDQDLAREIGNYILDTKWGIHELLTRYTGENAFVRIEPVPATEMYICTSGFPSSTREISAEERIFWHSLAAIDRRLEFKTSDELHHFYVRGRERFGDHALVVIVDAEKGSVDQLRYAQDVESLAVEQLRYWSTQLGTLWALQALSASILSELSRLRANVFMRLSTKAKRGVTQLLAKQRDINLLAHMILRLTLDIEPARLAELLDDDFPNATSEQDGYLSKSLCELIDVRFKEINAQLSLLQSAFKQEIDLRLLSSNYKWQLITTGVAFLSLIAAVIALFPDDTRKHLIPAIWDWFRQLLSRIRVC